MRDDPESLLHESEPADSESAAALYRKLCKASAALYLEARSQTDLCFATYRRVDTTRRGCISFVEYYDMVRVLLQLSPSSMSDLQAASLWQWAVGKRGKSMSTANFLKMMRAGARNGFSEEQAKLKRKLKIPDWNGEAHRPQDGPLWDDRSISFEEKAKERQEQDKPRKGRPQTARETTRKPLGPAWDTTIHQPSKYGPLWDDRTTTFKEQAAQREKERRKEMENFRNTRISAKGLRSRAEQL
jgi:hypothetical protein